jgi:flagellar basal-body rod protein FlgF
MDRLVYVAMSGAKETLRAQAANNHNLANASTVGFRADLSAFQSQAVQGAGLPTRVYATDHTVGWDAATGTLQETGRDLDVAVNGSGWIAVQGVDGREAYTRAGDLRVDVNGQLVNAAGLPVMGDSGPLAVPPHASISVARDGSVAIVPLGQAATTVATVGRIKLVNPPAADLQRGADGLFRLRTGSDAPADAGVQIASGALESSNVNIAESMTQMIELARQFDLQVKALRTAEEDAASSARLLQAG